LFDLRRCQLGFRNGITFGTEIGIHSWVVLVCRCVPISII
jgi:hypothetical protein